ncbi:MAG: hypothetical protein ACLUOI_11045 [Eisenbergiella sp.]
MAQKTVWYRDTIVTLKGVTMPHMYIRKAENRVISLCGVDCTDCEYFGTEEDRCAGCERYRASVLANIREEICGF